MGCLIKFTILGSIILNFCGIEPSIKNEYILGGFVSLITKLGIKGVIEAIAGNSILEPIELPTVMLMDASSENPQGNSREVQLGQSQGGQPAQPSQPGQPGQSAQPGQSQGNQSAQPGQISRGNMTWFQINRAWGELKYIDNEFKVEHGVITVHNPNNITSFYLPNGQPNTSSEAREYAQSIVRAFDYHSNFLGKASVPHPAMDPSSYNWYKGFMKENYPSRLSRHYLNSNPIRKGIIKFSSRS